MRDLYARASKRIRDELTAALQAHWESSLRERAAPAPRSPVPLHDNLLAPFHGRSATAPCPGPAPAEPETAPQARAACLTSDRRARGHRTARPGAIPSGGD
jgi:hypothetical protein